MSTSALAARQSSIQHLQERVATHDDGVGLTISRRGYAGLKRREATALYEFVHDATSVIVAQLHAAGALSAGTARPVEATGELAGVDLTFLLDRLSNEGILGMSATAAGDRYWIS